MKTVVITGCSVGVGRATALLLDRAGWRVFAIVRKQADADDLEAATRGPLKGVLADVTDRQEVFAAAAVINQQCREHGLDGLICNAGAGGAGPHHQRDLGFEPAEHAVGKHLSRGEVRG